MKTPLRDTETQRASASSLAPGPLPLWRKLLFALVPVTLLFLLLEALVRVTGAGDVCESPAKEELWTCDPVLHFKANPALRPGGRPLNRQGFRAGDMGDAPDARSVLVLGDSCTFGIIFMPELAYIREPYPQRLQTLLGSEEPVHVWNAGVPGYTSHHGLLLLETTLRHLNPDLIIVRFGWNDHFLNHQGPEADVLVEPESPLLRTLQYTLFRTALYRFTMRLRMEATPPPDPMQRLAAVSEWKPAVPLERYAHNLRRIVEIGRSRGADVWLLTAPHAFLTDEYRGRYEVFDGDLTGEGFVTLNMLGSFERLLEVHNAYAEATRRVSAETGAHLVDMIAVYRAHAGEHLFSDADILHPNEAGHALEAATLHDALVKAGWPPGGR